MSVKNTSHPSTEFMWNLFFFFFFYQSPLKAPFLKSASYLYLNTSETVLKMKIFFFYQECFSSEFGSWQIEIKYQEKWHIMSWCFFFFFFGGGGREGEARLPPPYTADPSMQQCLYHVCFLFRILIGGQVPHCPLPNHATDPKSWTDEKNDYKCLIFMIKGPSERTYKYNLVNINSHSWYWYTYVDI